MPTVSFAGAYIGTQAVANFTGVSFIRNTADSMPASGLALIAAERSTTVLVDCVLSGVSNERTWG